MDFHLHLPTARELYDRLAHKPVSSRDPAAKRAELSTGPDVDEQRAAHVETIRSAAPQNEKILEGKYESMPPIAVLPISERQELVPTKKENTMSVVTEIEKGINIADVWITAIDTKVKTIITAEKAIAPEVGQELSALVTKTQAFLSAATPAVAGEGLNFPADSVAYSAFVDLVSQFQTLAVPVEALIKAL